jgi:hypothetical protein
LDCYKHSIAKPEITNFHSYSHSIKKSHTLFNPSPDIEDNLLNVSKNSIKEEQTEKHRRGMTKLNFDNIQFDTNLLEKSECNENPIKSLDNKFLKLFSPKANTSLKFIARNKSFTQTTFDKLSSSLEILLKNNNISINLPVVYEANRNETKILENFSILDNGNYLFLFLDEKFELLFGLLMNSVGGKNISQFFKKVRNKTIEYSDVFEGITFEKNVIKKPTNFNFNLSSYTFIINSMKLMTFLCYKKEKMNVILYNNIYAIKIYDMC